MGVVDALVAAAAECSPRSSPPASPTFTEVLPAAVADPDQPRRPAKKQKREAMPPEYVKPLGKPGQLNSHWRRSFPDDEEDAKGRGKVVDVPDAMRLYGVWRRVPGFWKILASDLGYIMTEGDSCVRMPSVAAGHYLTVRCNGRTEQVHSLVCRAFKGRPKPDEVSVDHIGGKNLPIVERRQNNRETNLRWATQSEQIRNQGERKAYSSGEPCLVWEVVGRAGGSQRSAAYMTPVIGAARRFPSVAAAETALGLNQRQLSDILNGKRKTAGSTDGKRYMGKWDPDLADLEGEEWKEKANSSRNRLLLSNYGRLQRIYPYHEGTKHYPESSDANGYLTVHIDNQNKPVHVLVGELFWIGPKPRNWACWDHKDRDKQNNHIGNLRPVTREENGVNTARQRDFYLWKADDPDDWVRCVSQNDTARVYNLNPCTLNDVLRKRVRTDTGSIRTTVGGYCAVFCDEVDKEN